MAPIMMVNLRPSQSPEGPARAAPTKAPPVKTETTAPLHRSDQYAAVSPTMNEMAAYTSLGVGLKRLVKDLAVVAPAITPKS